MQKQILQTTTETIAETITEFNKFNKQLQNVSNFTNNDRNKSHKP